jgi:hypothetical protein
MHHEANVVAATWPALARRRGVLRDKDVGLDRKKPHVVRQGRSALHPGEFEPPSTRTRHKDHPPAHDLDRAVARENHRRKQRK